jgi:hypothetical protein
VRKGRDGRDGMVKEVRAQQSVRVGMPEKAV